VNYLLGGNALKMEVHFVRSKSGDGVHGRVIARVQTVF
jgi:hypothetical protein